MPLKHADIWRAIDRLAERNGFSPSGLALEAKLSPTVFNPSKRASKNRKRWPSTESIAKILQATGTTLDEFVGLATDEKSTRATLPLADLAQAKRAGAFDENGHPAGRGWEDIHFPHLADPHAFAVEISGRGMEPYRAGDRLIVSPAEKPRRGDRVLVRTGKGDLVIGEVGRDSAHKIELLPLTPEGATLSLAPRAIAWIYRIVWASQ